MVPIVLMVTAALTIGFAAVSEYQSRENPPEKIAAKARADLLKSYDWLVMSYFAANPSAAGVITWAQLSASYTTPPGMKNSPRFVQFSAVGSIGNYRICTNFSSRELSLAKSMLPGGGMLTASVEEECLAP